MKQKKDVGILFCRFFLFPPETVSRWLMEGSKQREAAHGWQPIVLEVRLFQIYLSELVAGTSALWLCPRSHNGDDKDLT